MSDVFLVLTCEHGGRDVPARWADRFDSPAARHALASHRGWDPGSLEVGTALASRLASPLVVQTVTRLLVECNRSLDHPALWSEFTEGLPDSEKREILARYWQAHRDAVREAVRSRPSGLVAHVGVHSFTPVWKGRRRSTDVGILYDPARPVEAPLAATWTAALRRDPVTRSLTVHRNRPYRGWTDGLTTALRSELPPERYAGIELEISQALVPAAPALVEALARTLAASLPVRAGR